MDRMRVYSELASELERYRRLSHDELARQIIEPRTERMIESPEGPVTIEVRVEWERFDAGPIRVTATAFGPSWWKLDRIEEAMTVKPPVRNV
jgi:hypothetical protein